MKKETKQIRRIFEQEYLRINAKYPSFVRPILRVTHHKNGRYGFCNWTKREVAINSRHPSKTFRSTIIHEICHQLDYDLKKAIGAKQNGSHNVEFWYLCYEFGLTERDYSYGLTGNMAKAKKIWKERNNGTNRVNSSTL